MRISDWISDVCSSDLVLGTDAQGHAVTLKDIWPTDEEIDEIVTASVKPEQFRQVYDPMFKFSVEHGEKVSTLYEWRPQSRTEERRVGKEGGSQGRSRWGPSH